MTEIYMQEDVARSAPEAIEAIVGYLRGGGGLAQSYELDVPFEEIGLPAIGKFSREVALSIGEPEQHRAYFELYSSWIPLSWEVPENPMLPAFAGWIEVTPLSASRAQLAIFGHYTPPGGPIGAGFDAVAGRKIAQATLGRLLSKLRRVAEGAQEKQQP